ncbi:MAG TPA: hypothetical protein VLD55_14025 [Candidatus Sulfobium mesophilum]|nr:hypothetical protein [Candidatus Sulfobium mesophilum]
MASGCDPQGGTALSLSHDAQKCLYDTRIKTFSGVVFDVRNNSFLRPRFAVRRFRTQRIPLVDYGKESRGQRDLVSFQSRRIAASVPPLRMTT